MNVERGMVVGLGGRLYNLRLANPKSQKFLPVEHSNISQCRRRRRRCRALIPWVSRGCK